MDSNYFLLFKTAAAEFRAWEHTSPEEKRAILPIIELTRGRRRRGAGADLTEQQLISTPDIYAFEKILEKTEESFSGCPRVIMDITREEMLNSFEINQLSLDTDGYKNWVTFIETQIEHYDELIPTILVNPSNDDYEEYESNLIKQVNDALDLCPGIAYRAAVLFDPGFLNDLEVVADDLNVAKQNGKEIFIILDHEFIRPGTSIIHAARTLGIIERLNLLLPEATIVTLATSFPRAIDDLGDPEHDVFPMEEVFLNEEINRALKHSDVHYGDYGSINPTRNDIVFASGWRPRIDFPTANSRTFYYREKRDKKHTYDHHYTSVAQDVMNDELFEELEGCWGYEKICEAATGIVPGKSPNFWISVRMSIHIHQQIVRIFQGTS